MLEVARDGAVAVVTLARPEKRNALSIELRAAFADALRDLGRDDDVRATVVTGRPPAFCAGMDVTEFGGDREHRERLMAANDAFAGALLEHPKPLVAAVAGPALGGGFVLALLCDLRIAGPEAAFGFPEIGRGVPPSLGAAMAALPPAVARELCLTGRVLDAAEALRLGVVSEVAGDPVAAALDRARAIAELPPRGVAQVVAWARSAGGEWREQLAREREALHRALFG